MSQTSLRSLVFAAGITMACGFALADQANLPDTRPAYYLSAGGSLPANNVAIGGLAPAEARAATRAALQYDQAMGNLQQSVTDARHDFQNSPDFQSASQGLLDAEAAYDAQSHIVQSALDTDPQYKKLLADRTDLDAQLRTHPNSIAHRTDLANRKLQISTLINAMETKAWGDSPDAAATRKRLASAKQAVNQMIDKFNAGLASNANVAAARTALQNASMERSEAQAYLQGVYLDRAAAQRDADSGYGAVVQYGNPYGPAYYGYSAPYGYDGFGYYGIPYVYGGFAIIAPEHHHHFNSSGSPVIGPGGGNLGGMGDFR